MSKYEVFIRNKTDGHVWTLFFMADDFGHAEEQAQPYLETYHETFKIEKEYE